MERKLLLVVLAVVGFSTLLWSAEGAVGCLDEKGNNVDWWVIVKSPKLEKHQDASAASGFGYSYGDSRNGQIKWTGKRLDTNKNGALGATLGQIYSAPQRTAYVIYNDQPPVGDDASSGFAHAKGAVAWDSDRGFWLIHSVPNFPPKATSNYGLPDNAVVNGQSFMCLTFSKSAMDQVGAALLIDRPFIFSKNLPSSLRSFSPNLAKVFDGEYTSEATASSFSVKTAGGDPFVIFAKNKAWGSDLYSKLVAPTLKSSLLVETWMNGATSNKLPSFCAGSKYPYSVMNVKEITLAPTISWGNSEDHSKWAVSTTSKPGAFCIGDINRQASQAGRGGGTVCGSDNAVWNSFKSFVTASKTCKGYNGN